MSAPGGADQVWAAYAVGHHPLSLMAHLEAVQSFRDLPQAGVIGVLTPLVHETKELNQAVTILRGAGHLTSAGPFLWAWGQARRGIEEVLNRSMWMDPPMGYMPATEELYMMQGFRATLLPGQTSLQRWCNLGAALGACRVALFDTDTLHNGVLPDEALKEVERAAAAFHPLGVFSISRQVGKALTTMRAKSTSDRGEVWKKSLQRASALTRLEGEMQEGLRKGSWTTPYLVLDQKGVTFFGTQRPLEAFSARDLACLWVLAEHPGVYVERNEIVRAMARPGNTDLKFAMKRLRDALETMFDSRASCSHSEIPGGHYIKGKKGKNGFPGPYMLDLPPERVWIMGPRPGCMKPLK